LRLRGKNWVIHWTENGVTRQHATGTTSREEAEERFAEWLAARREKPSGIRPAESVLIGDILTHYIETGLPELRVSTQKTVLYSLERLIPFWSGKTVSEVTGANCKAYEEHRREAGATSNNTIMRELASLSAALKRAMRDELIAFAPKVYTPKPPPCRERWLTVAEAARLLRAARAEPQARGHLPLFILMALYGGARKSAILELDWSQVDLQRGQIDWRNPDDPDNRRKRRTRIPIHRRLKTFLSLAARYRTGSNRAPISGPVLHRDGQPLKDIKKAFRSAVIRAGLETSGPRSVTPHVLRHTCGTWMAQAGVPLGDIAGYLGHSDAETSRRYAHHHPDHMQRALAGLDRR